MIGKIINNNCNEYFKELQDNSVDLIFTDPPYALGSEVIIREDGKPDYKKAVDFMDKWEQPDGRFWEQWFKEAYRVLKYGGKIIMFGMDRQIMLNKYYACLSGFDESQSLYWFSISSFPKSLDLSKMIDKNAGADREVIGISESTRINKPNVDVYDAGIRGKEVYITKPTTKLAKKYSGYKYSVAPLKQTNETIMVFQKPYKTGSCLHDTLAYENGDKECCCGAIDVDGNRVPFESKADKKESTDKNQHEDFGTKPMTNNIIYGDFSMVQPKNYNPEERYPAQTYIDSIAGKMLDKQSGEQKSISSKRFNGIGCGYHGSNKEYDTIRGIDDIGGCSRILHKCDYDEKDFDLYIYCPKVGNEERNAGCESLPEKTISGEDTGFGKMGINSPKYREGRGVASELPKVFNGHPTVKPISLLIKVLSLFKTPNPQIVLDTFAGSGSTGIACEKLGIEYILVDDKKEYCDIAELRTKYWSEYFKNEIHINNVAKLNEPKIENQLELF